MSQDGESLLLKTEPKTRVVKAPEVRRAELLDCAQALFLRKGYERTTINDVIAATGLSKGAFYHHFKAKEELLEAMARGVAQAAVANFEALEGGESVNALDRLNRVLAMGREWKLEHLRELRSMFVAVLRPENGVLYHRIVHAVLEALAPALKTIIEHGVREGLFEPVDAGVAAETLLWLAEGRRPVVIEALALGEAGDIDGAMAVIMRRVRAEEAIVDRILGLPAGSVAFGPEAELRAMMHAWGAVAAG